MAKSPYKRSRNSKCSRGAGQLGTDGIFVDFSKTMIDLGEAQIYQLMKRKLLAQCEYQMSQKDFSNLGSTSRFAIISTLKSIVNMGKRLQAGVAGLSEAEIMFFAASLSSVGIEAEVEASLSKSRMAAVETNSEKPKDYAKVVDVDLKDFSKAFKEDSGAIDIIY